MDVTLHGYSEDQLNGLNFEAIVKDYAQDPSKSSMPEFEKNGTKSPSGYSPTTSAVEKLRALSQDVDPNGYLSKERRPASANLNGYKDTQHRIATVAPPYSVAGDGVMPTAIVGMSCRFPGGASDVEKFWNLVSEGRSAWSRVPEDRFNVDAFYHPNADRIDTVRSRAPLGLTWPT